MYTVLASRTFQKQFESLERLLRSRIRSALEGLKEDPLSPGPGADIRPLRGTKPQKHRLRIGDYRIVYAVEGSTVKLIELFHRGRGYG